MSFSFIYCPFRAVTSFCCLKGYLKTKTGDKIQTLYQLNKDRDKENVTFKSFTLHV